MLSYSEVSEKKNRIRNLMVKLNLDAILLRKHCNFSWLTCGGINYVSIATEMGSASLLITRNEEYVICNNIEAKRMEQEEKLLNQDYKIKSFQWYNDYEEKIINEIVKGGKIGSDGSFPGTIDISKYLNPLRYSLTPREVEKYKEVGYLASKAIEEYQLHHQGGAIGYTGRDYKVNFQTTEIVQENQGFTWNPSITGSKSEDTMLATSNGPLLLSKPIIFPQLEIKIGGEYIFVRPDILEK